MNVRLSKRTEQIDRQREKLIGWGTLGPIWTEAGSAVLTGDQKVELAHSLAAQRHRAAVEQCTLKVLEAGAGFFETTVMATAPQAVIESYTSRDTKLFVDWLVKSGWACVRDGFTCLVLRNGEEVARTTAKVPAIYESDVLVALRVESMMAQAKDARGN